ncbi:MAG: RsiV family protein [Peptostreptococcales bacterium]|jgi:hypothetical protein
MAIVLPAKIIPQSILKSNLYVYYPMVKVQNPMAEYIINKKILDLTHKLINIHDYFQNPSTTEVWIHFEIKNNQRNILSLNLISYGYTQHAAHGMTYIESLTLDTQTGYEYSLSDLFKKNSDYVKELSDQIKLQIKERDIFLLEEFNEIRPDQDYYIADKALVIYFQLYEITPYAFGFPMFPISVYSLQDIYKEDGVLDRMSQAY